MRNRLTVGTSSLTNTRANWQESSDVAESVHTELRRFLTVYGHD